MAGWQTHLRDVLAGTHPIALTEVGLGSYTLLPHHRTGTAAAYRTPFTTSARARGRIDVTVPLTDGSNLDGGTGRLLLRGPGDVLGIDPRQVVRRYPSPGTRDAEPSDLAHCELDQPDLPWLFTPTGPDAGGHLPPWLRLVVVPDDPGLVRPPDKPGLPAWADVALADLPPEADAWAWAHVQVLGSPREPGASGQDPRLSPENPALNVARLLCPRELEPNRSWTALLVPTFEVGRRAGLGITDPLDDLRWAWTLGGPESTVRLPVYDHWSFSTGLDGDFESLARRIQPVHAPVGTGRRLVDTSDPGLGLDVTTTGGPRAVHGALTHPVPDAAGDTAAAVPPPGAAGVWDDEAVEALRARVEQPDHVQFDAVGFDPAERDPELAPPLYGGTHLATGTLAAAGAEPVWLRQLNLDPAHRIAAGLGAAVARMDQEDLMTSAWAQLPSVLDANAALRAAQFARFVGDRLHSRHLARLDPGALLAVTSRAHSRLLAEPGSTTRAVVGRSATPTAATASTLRALARPGGPLRRFAADGSGPLLADGDVAHDWVWRYSPPDGARGIGDVGRALLAELGVADPDALAAGVAEPSLIDAITDGGAGAAPGVDPATVTRLALSGVLEVLLTALPTVREVESPEPGRELDQSALDRAASLVSQAGGLIQAQDEWWLPRPLTTRHELPGTDVPEAPGRLAVGTPDLQDLVTFLWERLVHQGAGQGQPAGEAFDEPTAGAARRLVEVFQGETERLVEALAQAYDDAFIGTDSLSESVREVLVVPSLHLLPLLEPAVTIGRRVHQRIPGLDAHFPGWLDNQRYDSVMAAPRFTHPMYEALHRHDPEWLLPGVASIDPHEMMTTLATNPVFVEAFLVGLNHEFMRELVWRGYPTDGRGTSFRSFWSPTDELDDEIHRLRGGDLGTHLGDAASGRLVVLVRGELVRRHPHLLGVAVQQDGGDEPVGYRRRPARTLFQLRIGPDLLLTGVDLTAQDALTADPLGPDGTLEPVPRDGAWWFTLSEHVGEPRFGLDVTPGPGDPPLPPPPRARDDLAWADWPLVGAHLSPATAPRPAGAAANPTSADLAWLLFQLPARAGYRLGRMLRPRPWWEVGP
ncbi:hypothetical protein [Actinotalea sp.]|uniref:hypothetical protein n=1 Tax=Actinotalea sp. TaxID=1872145 RepID=UPI002BAE06FC|nr:hypothetical protein [Actinotalea sp.]HRA51257.1 hypothetical protein [Actinotalea sp.]